ncbi:hypothetical protein BDA99DRAFT_438716, partial [Phascolomyces articulosus]
GTRSDILYCPDIPTESLPPILVEIQNVVDPSFMYRLQQYCANVYNNIMLTSTTNMEYNQLQLHSVSKMSYIKMLPSKYYATKHYIMTPASVDNTLGSPSSSHSSPLGYVLTKQEPSIQALEYKHDVTVQLLYTIAKNVLKNEIRKEEETVDVLVDVCRETQQQLKRIMDVLEDDEKPRSKLACRYANAGVTYSSVCLQKYTQGPVDISFTMPEPRSLLQDVAPTRGRSSTLVLPTLEPLQEKTDMDFIEEFIKEWEQCHR